MAPKTRAVAAWSRGLAERAQASLGPHSHALAPSSQSHGNQRVDAWFTCFAPADHPSLVVAVMVVNANGDGGTVAAPIARQILASGLGAG